MVRFSVAIAAAVLGMASMQGYAKEVDLTDHDRMELRQRADALRSSDMLGRDRVMSDRTGHRHVKKTGHTRKHHTRKHARRGHA